MISISMGEVSVGAEINQRVQRRLRTRCGQREARGNAPGLRPERPLIYFGEIKKPAEFLSAGFYESAIYSATTSSTTFAETLE